MTRDLLFKAWQDLGKDADDKVLELARRYQLVFSTPEGQMCLEDLKRMFYIHDTTIDTDMKFKEVNEGNRQVVLYVLKMLDMDASKSDYVSPEQE